MYIGHEMEVIAFEKDAVFTGLTPGSMDESGGGGSTHSVGGDAPSSDI